MTCYKQRKHVHSFANKNPTNSKTFCLLWNNLHFARSKSPTPDPHYIPTAALQTRLIAGTAVSSFLYFDFHNFTKIKKPHKSYKEKPDPHYIPTAALQTRLIAGTAVFSFLYFDFHNFTNIKNLTNHTKKSQTHTTSQPPHFKPA